MKVSSNDRDGIKTRKSPPGTGWGYPAFRKEGGKTRLNNHSTLQLKEKLVFKAEQTDYNEVCGSWISALSEHRV